MKLKDYIGETTSYDKKLMLERKDPMSWLKSVSAFANTQGGKLLFGVANDGSLRGLADAQGDSEFISETIKMQMDPVPEIDLTIVQELDLRQVASMRRNPVIADLFQRLDLMERRGSGFKKILDAYAFESEKRGETIMPRFESTSTDFFLILPNLNYGKVINGVVSSSNGQGEDVSTDAGGEKSREKGREKSREKIIAALKQAPYITMSDLAELIGISAKGVEKNIKILRDQGIIRRVGPDKGGHWEVIEKSRG